MGLTLERATLDILMPMNVQADDSGRILHVGPTLAKTRAPGHFLGKQLTEVFDFRRPRATEFAELLAQHQKVPLRLSLSDSPNTALRGIVVAAEPGDGIIINLSFGISILDAIRDYELHSRDFANTDPTLEMLYLIEAKSAAMEESRDLNMRLQGAKIAAEEQAFTDTLTGLKNRRALDHVLQRYCDQGETFTLLGIDLDYFKSVNDTYGHAAGDHVLQKVARILVDTTTPGDTLVRNGGDEFLVVLQDQADLDAAQAIGERLIERIEDPIPFENNICRISASIGVSTSAGRPPVDMAQILVEVDAALYQSKRAGRAQVTRFAQGMELDPSNQNQQPPDARIEARPV